MNNHVTASVEFYFKSIKYSASIELDLDQHMKSAGKVPELFPMLARAIELDFYSYEYEMMQAEPIVFSKAEGIVADHITDGALDIPAFEEAWTEAYILEKLDEIALQYLDLDEISQHPKLKKALLEAYQLGYKAKTSQ